MDEELLAPTGEPAIEDAPTDVQEAEEGSEVPLDAGDEGVTEGDAGDGDDAGAGDGEIIDEDLWLIDDGGTGEEELIDDGGSGDDGLIGDEEWAGDDVYFDEEAIEDAELIGDETIYEDDQFTWDGDVGTDSYDAADVIEWAILIPDFCWTGEVAMGRPLSGEIDASLEAPDFMGICVLFPIDAII